MRRVAGILFGVVLLSFKPYREPRYRVVTVREGDTLAGIARTYGSTVRELATLNALRNPDVIGLGKGILVPENDKTDALPVYAPHSRYADRPSCSFERWEGGGRSYQQDRSARVTLRHRTISFERPEDDSPVTITVDGRSFALASTWIRRLLSAAEVDLDRDGTNETIVAVLRDAGNGIAIERIDLLVVSKSGISSVLDLEGGDEVAATDEDVDAFPWERMLSSEDGFCSVRLGRWEDLRDPIDGDGLYFVRRPYRFSSDRFVPVETPIEVRRYGSTRRDAWDTDPTLEHLDLRWEMNDANVRVHEAPMGDDETPPELEVEGMRETIGVTYPNDDECWMTYVGDARTQRLFPMGSSPPDARYDVRVEESLRIPYACVSRIFWLR